MYHAAKLRTPSQAKEAFFCYHPKAILSGNGIISGCQLTAGSPESAHHRPTEHWWLSEDNK